MSREFCELKGCHGMPTAWGGEGWGKGGCKEYRLLMSRNLRLTQYWREPVLEEGRKKEEGRKRKNCVKSSTQVFVSRNLLNTNYICKLDKWKNIKLLTSSREWMIFLQSEFFHSGLYWFYRCRQSTTFFITCCKLWSHTGSQHGSGSPSSPGRLAALWAPDTVWRRPEQPGCHHKQGCWESQFLQIITTKVKPHESSACGKSGNHYSTTIWIHYGNADTC